MPGEGKTGILSISSDKMKVTDLPVSATEDRVVGTLDIEHAIKKGKSALSLGYSPLLTGVSCM